MFESLRLLYVFIYLKAFDNGTNKILALLCVGLKRKDESNSFDVFHKESIR